MPPTTSQATATAACARSSPDDLATHPAPAAVTARLSAWLVKSPEVMRALIGIALDPSEDTRARIVAIQEILGRAFGRIPAEVKTTEAGPATLDASKLSDRELEALWKLVGSKPDGTALQ